MPTIIDRSTWPRRHHLAFFEGFSQPHFQLTSEVDATALVSALGRTGEGVFPAMLHAVTWASNAETAFRLRLRWPDPAAPAQVVLHDRVHPSFTAKVEVPLGDRHAPGCDLPLFGYATALFHDHYATFRDRVRAVSERVRHEPDLVAHAATDTDQLLFVSSLPWMSFSSVTHAMHAPQRDSTPRVMWGRFERRGDRSVVQVSAQVHHGLADGGHVARWFERLSRRLAEPTWLTAPARSVVSPASPVG